MHIRAVAAWEAEGCVSTSRDPLGRLCEVQGCSTTSDVPPLEIAFGRVERNGSDISIARKCE